MIGLLLIGLSWSLLRLERKPLAVLGFDRPARRGLELGAGLLLAAAFVAVQQLASGAAGGYAWRANGEYSLASALEALRFNVNSVLFEELTFRGYLLYQAVRLLGPRRAVALSAAAFGVYHWFSYGVLGQPVTMAFVFVLTGAAGLMFAVAFTRTGSLALPVGLHLGWNLANILVFSNGPLGDQLLIREPPDAEVTGTTALLLNIALPLSLPALVLWKLPRRDAQRPAGGAR